MENFNFEIARNFQPEEALEYLNLYFKPHTKDIILVYENGKFIERKLNIVKRVYFKRLPKLTGKLFFNQFY